MNWPRLSVSFFLLLVQCGATLSALETGGAGRSGVFEARRSRRSGLHPGPVEGPKQLWKINVGDRLLSVSVSAGRVFTMGNRDNVDTVFCLDADNGRTVWSNSYPCPLDPRYYEGGPGATPTVDGERVFTFSKKGHVLCIDARSGRTIWSRDLVEDLSLQLPEWSFAGSVLVETICSPERGMRDRIGKADRQNRLEFFS